MNYTAELALEVRLRCEKKMVVHLRMKCMLLGLFPNIEHEISNKLVEMIW